MKFFQSIFLLLLGLGFYNLSLQAQIKSTYTYKVVDGDSLKLDVYHPEIGSKLDSLPVVVWMHGGGFSGGSRDLPGAVHLMEYVTRRGYVGVSISYRLLRKGSETGFGCNCPKSEKLETFKQAAIDYLDATNYIVERHSDFKIDPTKIIAAGNSAGAEGVLSAVYMKPFFLEDLQPYKNVTYSGVLSFSGAMVNAEYITFDNALPTVLYHGAIDELVPFSSGAHHLCGPEDPGYLILDGSQTIADRLETLEQSFFFKKVKNGGHEVNAIPFPELDEIFTFLENTRGNPDIIQTTKISVKQ